MRVLVTGGTGTVGSAVVHELMRHSVEVRVLTRRRERAAALPAGTEIVVGDLLDPATVLSVFDGADAVFLLNAVSQTETQQGLLAVNGAVLAGVARIVYLSVHHLDQSPQVPNFGSKLPVELAIAASGRAYTILRANSFFQNDYWYQQAMLEHGVYPQPLGGIGVSRVDVRDIAEAAAIALRGGAGDAEIYNLAGPEAHTGQSTAREWSDALERPVAYAGDDLDAWQRQAAQQLPAWMAFDLRLMYEVIQRQGLVATPQDLQRLTALLGHAPRGFAAFAEETARRWLAA